MSYLLLIESGPCAMTIPGHPNAECVLRSMRPGPAGSACAPAVVRAFRQLRRGAHQIADGLAEALQQRIVTGVLETLFADDRELPLRQHHVVVEVVDLASG